MKTFLTLFVLLFSSLVFADDISDFQIEGMSIGDSLLDYYSKEEMHESILNFPYKDNEYTQVRLKINNLKLYDSVEATYKTDDLDYKIVQITALIFLKDMKKCKNKKNEIFLEVEKLFDENNIEINHYNRKHAYDTSGKSLVIRTSFKFKSEDYIFISCFDWSKEIEKKHPSWSDNLRIDLLDYTFNKWLKEVQYN